MSDSPETLIRIRWNAGAPSWLMARASLAARGARRASDDVLSLAHREAREAPEDDVLARLGRVLAAQLLDGLAVVLVAVDVDLVEQHNVAQPLLDLALDDARADVLGLVGGLLLEDASLGVADVGRDLVVGDPAGLRRGREVKR